jgi:hypothetical protein
MPHVIALILLGAGVYAGYRGFVRVAGRMREDLQRTEDEMPRPVVVEKDLGTLEYDPSTGVYRPRQRS